MIEATLDPSMSMWSCNPLIGGSKGLEPVEFTMMFGCSALINGRVASCPLKINRFVNLEARCTR